MSIGVTDRRLDEATRVKLAASSRTAPDALCVLAEDPSVTVRAAVAMNAACPVHADEVLAQDGDERVRMLLARKLASFVPALGEAEQVRLREQAIRLLAGLVEDEAIRVRAAIADVVKEMPEAPKPLILRLARDAAVTVSEPVIRLSPLLTPEDLLTLLSSPPAPETVTAIARRPHLTEAVSDAVVATADTAAIRSLLANGSAAIREATLDSLIVQSAQHADWHEPLVRRPALPAHAARALSEIVATQLLDVLARRGDLDPALIEELRRKLTERLSREQGQAGAQPKLTTERAIAEAQALAADGRLTEDALLKAAQRGEARLASALLATASGMPLAVVERAAALRSAKGLISLCWKAGFSMRVAGPLQALLARIPPSAALAAGPGGNFPLAPAEMRWQLEFLGRMGG